MPRFGANRRQCRALRAREFGRIIALVRCAVKIKISLFWVLAALMVALTPRAAHADLGFWTKNLIGVWTHPVTMDQYIFRSDAKYIKTNNKSGAGAVSEEGWWKIVQATEKEGGSMEGPVTLVLKARKRITGPLGKETTKPFVRQTRHVVDVAYKGKEMDAAIDTKRYWFDRVKLERSNTKL